MDIILAPDVFVNASVAPGTPPDQVVQRVLGKHPGESGVSQWVMGRVRAMLDSLPDFKTDAVDDQLRLIASLVREVEVAGDFDAAAWQQALVATAKAAGVGRVVTDHPDLLEAGAADGVVFVSTDEWLLEATMPPPTPGS